MQTLASYTLLQDLSSCTQLQERSYYTQLQDLALYMLLQVRPPIYIYSHSPLWVSTRTRGSACIQYTKYNAGRCTTMSMERLGLALDRHHMVWAVNHGVGQWAPRWVQQMIVCAWNWLSCRLLGHDHLVQEEPNGPAHCVSCCRNLRVTPGMPLIRVWEDDHDDDTSDAV